MERYFNELAEAFVRGRLGRTDAGIHDGIEAGLRLHKFKANAQLPRVQRVLGILRGLAPGNLLDIGSGRWTFLWPLLAGFPELAVTSADWNERRASDVGTVRRGGIERLTSVRMDAQRPAFAAKSFEVVTMLEVLEHLPNPQAALEGLAKIARRFLLLSVPSTPDENPEHIHLFSVPQLHEMARQAGALRTTIEHVLNHRIVVMKVGE